MLFDFFNDGTWQDDFREIVKKVETAEFIQMDDGTGIAYDISGSLNHCREGPTRCRRG